MGTSIVTHDARFLTHVAEILWLISPHLHTAATIILILLEVSSALGALFRITLFSGLYRLGLLRKADINGVMLIHCWLLGMLLFTIILDFGHWNILSLLIVNLACQGIVLNCSLLLSGGLLVWWSLIGDGFTSLMDQGQVVLLQKWRLTTYEVFNLLLLLNQVIVELGIA